MLGIIERRRMKRQVWDDLVELRNEHPDLSAEEFEVAGEEYLRDRYRGVNPENLKMILDFLKELAPLFIKIFFFVLLVMAAPFAAIANDLSRMCSDLGDPLAVMCSAPTNREDQPQPIRSAARAFYSRQFRQQWTWPGMTEASLRNHLATHSNHRIPLAELQTMTFAELQAIHNSDHDGIQDANTSSFVPITRNVVTAQQSGGCPGGVCPSPNSFGMTRGRFFGRFR